MHPLQERTAAGYAGLLHVKKSSNVDGASTWQSMLASVHGLSASRAKVLAERFPSAKVLVTELAKASTPKSAVKMLAEIQLDKKKLGPKLAGRLLEIFGSVH